MEAPTATDVRNWSDVNFARYGYGEDARLQVQVTRAIGYVLYITGQSLASPDASNTPLGDPANLVPILEQAVQMRTEQLVMQGRVGYVSSAAEKDVIQSFSVGSYSETRASGGFTARTGAAEKSINKWPSLEELLWMLMTPERYEFWLAFVSGQQTPDFAVEEVAWGPFRSAIEFFEPWDRYVLVG